MLRLLIASASIVLILGCAGSGQTESETSRPWELVWTAAQGLDAPESAYYDRDSKTLFISNVAGAPAEKDGTGWISKLTLNGEVTDARWVTGLNAPKGMRSHRGTLWVSDIDHLVAIDISAGRVVQRIPVPEARFLNDVATAEDGTVFVSDTLTSRIYQYKDGSLSLFAEGEDLEYPNGLLAEKGRLVIAGWGKPESDFSTKIPGRLYALDLKTRQKTLITPQPVGNLDGLERDGRGAYIVTDWMAGEVMQIDRTGKVSVLLSLTQGTADHAYLADRGLLVLPRMTESRVEAYRRPR